MTSNKVSSIFYVLQFIKGNKYKLVTIGIK